MTTTHRYNAFNTIKQAQTTNIVNPNSEFANIVNTQSEAHYLIVNCCLKLSLSIVPPR